MNLAELQHIEDTMGIITGRIGREVTATIRPSSIYEEKRLNMPGNMMVVSREHAEEYHKVPVKCTECGAMLSITPCRRCVLLDIIPPAPLRDSLGTGSKVPRRVSSKHIQPARMQRNVTREEVLEVKRLTALGTSAVDIQRSGVNLAVDTMRRIRQGRYDKLLEK